MPKAFDAQRRARRALTPDAERVVVELSHGVQVRDLVDSRSVRPAADCLKTSGHCGQFELDWG